MQVFLSQFLPTFAFPILIRSDISTLLWFWRLFHNGKSCIAVQCKVTDLDLIVRLKYMGFSLGESEVWSTASELHLFR